MFKIYLNIYLKSTNENWSGNWADAHLVLQLKRERFITGGGRLKITETQSNNAWSPAQIVH